MTSIERKKETIEVWNICECGAVLHSLAEGTRGTCSHCWFKSMPPDTKAAMNRLISSAFQKEKPTGKEIVNLIDDAISKLNRDEAQ